MATPPIAPFLRTPLPACSIVVDRHVHKNGGSTVRELFLRNELYDGWLYWGYGLAHTQRVVAGLIELLLGPPNRSCSDWSRRPVLRLAAELHYSYMTAEAMMVAFGPWSPLQQLASHCGCRLVMVTRLREPLDFYVSFFRWVTRGCTRRPLPLQRAASEPQQGSGPSPATEAQPRRCSPETKVLFPEAGAAAALELRYPAAEMPRTCHARATHVPRTCHHVPCTHTADDRVAPSRQRVALGRLNARVGAT